MNDLIAQMKKGDRRALSRLLSQVELRDESAFKILEQVWPLTGKAFTVGITGPAGAGKSTLIDQLVTHLREKKLKVGVIAVDPTSPFSGGAVLGDRVRMQRHFNDPDVFIRSVGTRGKSGGISFSTRAQIQVLDAFGTDVILVETVGAGQSEVDIADLVDTVVVVLVPEAGDSIQALKAGILEIANVYVVNKKDRSGAEQVAHHLETMISMSPKNVEWKAPILLTESLSGEGVSEVWKSVQTHQAFLKKEGVPKVEKLRRRKHELLEIIETRISSRLAAEVSSNKNVIKELEKEEKPNLYSLSEEFIKL